jgi:molybdopterin-guanine dinucleotide biosynthesis protein A
LFMQTAAFVLAGGKSARMGRDKALLACASRPLIKEVASKLAVVARNVTIIGPPERYRHLGLPVLPDLRPGCGPLAGIEAALASSAAEYNLIAACDMPGIRTGWLKRLLQAAKQTGALCTAACDQTGTIHPLLAVYRSDSLPAVRSALDSGRFQLLALLETLSAVTVSIGGRIWNLNTPEEWESWSRSIPLAGAPLQ